MGVLHEAHAIYRTWGFKNMSFTPLKRVTSDRVEFKPIKPERLLTEAVTEEINVTHAAIKILAKELLADRPRLKIYVQLIDYTWSLEPDFAINTSVSCFALSLNKDEVVAAAIDQEKLPSEAELKGCKIFKISNFGVPPTIPHSGHQTYKAVKKGIQLTGPRMLPHMEWRINDFAGYDVELGRYILDKLKERGFSFYLPKPYIIIDHTGSARPKQPLAIFIPKDPPPSKKQFSAFNIAQIQQKLAIHDQYEEEVVDEKREQWNLDNELKRHAENLKKHDSCLKTLAINVGTVPEATVKSWMEQYKICGWTVALDVPFVSYPEIYQDIIKRHLLFDVSAFCSEKTSIV